MSIEDIVGYLFTFAVLLFVFGRNIYEEMKRRKDPKYAKEKEEQEKALKEFRKSIDDDMERTKETPPPLTKKMERPAPPKKQPAAPKKMEVPRTVKDQFKYNTKYDQYKPKTAIEQRQLSSQIDERYKTHQLGANVVSSDMHMDDAAKAYAISSPHGPSRGRALLKGLHDKKKMLIMQEILNAPRGFRPY